MMIGLTGAPMRRYRLGRHRIVLLIVLGLGLACAPERILVEDPAGDDDAALTDVEPHSPNSLRVLNLTTFDGSGQTVHPDFAQMTSWENPFVIAATPYPFGSAQSENPSLFWRDRGFDWTPIGEESNPVATPTGSGYLSDPDIVAVPDGSLWLYYRQVDKRNRILLIKTRNGIDFTSPTEVVSGANHTVISPAVVRRDSTRWRMWSVNAGQEGCRAGSTTVELRRSTDGEIWSEPVAISLVQRGFSVWHIDVQWIPSRKEYWALYNAKTASNCATQYLYLATSPDGVKWRTYPSPILTAGVIPEFADIVYRSTFSYNPASDQIRFWYSGARAENGIYVWQSAFDRRDRSEVFAAISKPMSSPPAFLSRRALLPLTDPP